MAIRPNGNSSSQIELFERQYESNHYITIVDNQLCTISAKNSYQNCVTRVKFAIARGEWCSDR